MINRAQIMMTIMMTLWALCHALKFLKLHFNNYFVIITECTNTAELAVKNVISLNLGEMTFQLFIKLWERQRLVTKKVKYTSKNMTAPSWWLTVAAARQYNAHPTRLGQTINQSYSTLMTLQATQTEPSQDNASKHHVNRTRGKLSQPLTGWIWVQ